MPARAPDERATEGETLALRFAFRDAFGERVERGARAEIGTIVVRERRAQRVVTWFVAA